MHRRWDSVLCAAALLVAPAGVVAHTGHGPTLVDANGSSLFGGLAFAPGAVALTVGDRVQWRNRDSLSAHTATEEHGLWGASMQPGQTSAPQTFDAGTYRYRCSIHPVMRGGVTVPTHGYLDQRAARQPKRKRGKPRRRFRSYVVAQWAARPPAGGLAFDVERRRAGGPWQRWRTATTAARGEFFVGRRGVTWEVRARLRRTADDAAASGWSPAVSVRA